MVSNVERVPHATTNRSMISDVNNQSIPGSLSDVMASKRPIGSPVSLIPASGVELIDSSTLVHDLVLTNPCSPDSY